MQRYAFSSKCGGVFAFFTAIYFEKDAFSRGQSGVMMHFCKDKRQKRDPVQVSFSGGAGRSRTAVQTSNKCAFYMLIRWLVVGAAPDIGTQGSP